MSNFKAQAHERELKQRLALSLAGAVFSESLDADGFPQLSVIRGAETLFIKISALDNAGRVDGLGLPQRVYSPHKCQILQATAAVDAELRAKAFAACAKLGMKLELFEIALLPPSFDLTGASLVASIPSDEINPLTQSQ